MEEDKKEDKLGKAPETEVKVWGLGLTNNKLDKLIEIADKQQKFLYFLEKRQKEIFDWMQKNSEKFK